MVYLFAPPKSRIVATLSAQGCKTSLLAAINFNNRRIRRIRACRRFARALCVGFGLIDAQRAQDPQRVASFYRAVSSHVWKIAALQCSVRQFAAIANRCSSEIFKFVITSSARLAWRTHSLWDYAVRHCWVRANASRRLSDGGSGNSDLTCGSRPHCRRSLRSFRGSLVSLLRSFSRLNVLELGDVCFDGAWRSAATAQIPA